MISLCGSVSRARPSQRAHSIVSGESKRTTSTGRPSKIERVTPATSPDQCQPRVSSPGTPTASVAVVSTAVGDVAGLLDALPGCTVVGGPAGDRRGIPDDGDAQGLTARLASALVRALDGGPGAAARERVLPFGHERIAARLLAIYAELHGAAGGSAGAA